MSLSSRLERVMNRTTTENIEEIVDPSDPWDVMDYTALQQDQTNEMIEALQARVMTCIHLSVLRYYKKNWGFGDIFSFWFFNIKLFSELVVLYFQTFLQKPS